MADIYYKENVPVRNLSQIDTRLESFVDMIKQAKITYILKLVKNVEADKNFKGDIEISVFHDSRIDICEYIEDKIFIKVFTLRDCFTLKDIRDLCCQLLIA